MKKKDKKLVYVISGIALILVIILLVNLKPLSITGNLDRTETILTQINSHSAFYTFSAYYPNNINPGDCSSPVFTNIDFTASTKQDFDELPEFVPNLQETYIQTKDVTLYGVTAILNICSDNAENIGIDYENLTANCLISNYQGKASITCKFTGKAYGIKSGIRTGANIYGLSRAYAVIEFPYIGSCPSGQIKCSDGGCKEKCELPPEPNYLIIVVIVLVLIGITYFLFKLYKKSK